MTRLQSDLAKLLEALATYVRPPEMQELLLKGDRYSTQILGAIADKSAIHWLDKGAGAANAQAASTARGLLVDCQVALAWHVIAV